MPAIRWIWVKDRIEGVSTRRVDDLVKALGCDGISKPVLSLPKGVRSPGSARNWTRWWRVSWAGIWVITPIPIYGWMPLPQKVRETGRIVKVSVIVATAVNGEGPREILGMDVGTSEDGAFWLAFLRSLNARGLNGAELVISDAHHGLRDAVATVLAGAAWHSPASRWRTALSLPKGVVAQSLGATEQGDTQAHRRGGNLPQSSCSPPPRLGSAGRTTRRMG